MHPEREVPEVKAPPFDAFTPKDDATNIAQAELAKMAELRKIQERQFGGKPIIPPGMPPMMRPPMGPPKMPPPPPSPPPPREVECVVVSPKAKEKQPLPWQKPKDPQHVKEKTAEAFMHPFTPYNAAAKQDEQQQPAGAASAAPKQKPEELPKQKPKEYLWLNNKDVPWWQAAENRWKKVNPQRFEELQDEKENIRSKFMREFDNLDPESVKGLIAWQQENREKIEDAINIYARQVAEALSSPQSLPAIVEIYGTPKVIEWLEWRLQHETNPEMLEVLEDLKIAHMYDENPELRIKFLNEKLEIQTKRFLVEQQQKLYLEEQIQKAQNELKEKEEKAACQRGFGKLKSVLEEAAEAFNMAKHDKPPTAQPSEQQPVGAESATAPTAQPTGPQPVGEACTSDQAIGESQSAEIGTGAVTPHENLEKKPQADEEIKDMD